MEQQHSESQPPPLSEIHRDSRLARSSPAPATTPLVTPPQTTSESTLSSSEPSLRFPRPQGSRDLANWITSSTPDIMRLTTTTEDTGLSESTYELVSGNDSESQDDNYTESISESVGSLDLQRPDDVHSLASIEPTNDESHDDDSLIDESEANTQATPDSPVEESYDTLLEPTESPLQQSEGTIAATCEAPIEGEAPSRSSLEYTQESLKTPSIASPEASGIVERPASSIEAADQDADDPRKRFTQWLIGFWNNNERFEPIAAETAKLFFSIFVLAIVTALLFPLPPRGSPHVPAVNPVVTTATPQFALSSSKHSTVRALATSTASASLTPLGNVVSNDWLFTAKQPDLSVSKQDGNFLVRMPTDAMDRWLAKGCLDFTAHRGDEVVRMAVSSEEDGMLIRFPKEESYGTVTVDIAATCRPKFQKVLKITFARGIVGDAIHRTKSIANDLTGFVPAAAQEAERRFEDAKRSWETTSSNILSASDELLDTVKARLACLHQSLGGIKSDIREQVHAAKKQTSEGVEELARRVRDQLPYAEDIQNQAEIGLLDAQIAAKMWWLKATGQKAEYDRYRGKARDFMTSKITEAKEVKATRNVEETSNAGFRLWSHVFGERRCGNNPRAGRRGTHQCIYAS